MNKLKVTTVAGTRPEIIRLSRVIKRLDDEPAIEHIFIHTGQNYDYELNEIFFEDLELRAPDYFLNTAGETAGETIGNVIKAAWQAFEANRPDAVLILGDTNSCLAAIPAKRLKIPIFHMEAGNRCFDMRVPEEINRRIVDHVSDVNLTYSSIAREYLLREGLPPDRVIKTGSPMKEVILANFEKIQASRALESLGLESREYFLVSAHREENIDNLTNLSNLVASINAIAEIYGKRIIFSAHPRTRKKLDSSNLALNKLIELNKPLGFTDYVALQIDSQAVLSDSGTITEESSILNFPALNIREAHERPEGMEQASVMMTGLRPERVIQGLRILGNQPRGDQRMLKIVEDYDIDNVSEKVLRIILSYTDYINRTVWMKELGGEIANTPTTPQQNRV